MIYIKLDEDKNLMMTVYEPIYHGENLNQKMKFLIPMTLDDIDVRSTIVYLSYIRADGNGDIVILTCDADPYNANYLQYTLPVKNDLTKYVGEVCMWMQFYSGETCNPIIAKSGECMVRVLESKDIAAYIDKGNPVTALYQMQKLLDENMAELEKNMEAIENISGDVTEVVENVVVGVVADAIANKADALAYDEHTRELTLMSGEEKIGVPVVVPGDSYMEKAEDAVEDEWSDMNSTDEVYEEWEPM